MKVLCQKPEVWCLLEHEGEYYIRVNCESGFASFSVSVMLNESEKGHFKRQGEEFSKNLAMVISEKADFNHPRNIKDKTKLAEISEAIMKHNLS